MTDVERLILEAWEKLGRKIMADPDELAKRLARRRSALLTRPPRAWCLALRASDRRITPAHWVISPEHALDLDHPAHPYEPIEHEVIIRPHALRKYCRPVRTDSWGEQVQNVARQLGVLPSGLTSARWAGIFTERFVKGLGGKRGKYPVPLIHSWTTLDPGGTTHFSKPDSLWGGLWPFLADMIRDNFEQTIIRRPKFRSFRTTAISPVSRRRRKNHSPRIFDDGSQLIGFRWICPSCKKEVRKIYYPLPCQTLFDHLGYDPANDLSSKSQIANCQLPIPLNPEPRTLNPHPPFKTPPKNSLRYDLHQLDPPPPTFACGRCHRVRGLQRTNDNGWNEIVSHLTRGLLFGHEVQKPTWYRTPRKRARSRQLRRPAPKREAIFEQLQLGHTLDQIAADLLIPRPSVKNAINHILRQHGVKSRRDLAKKLAWKTDQPLNKREKIRATAQVRDEQIEQLLLQDLTYKEIAQKLAVPRSLIDHAAERIYKRHGLPPKSGKKALAQKLGQKLPTQSISEEFRQRLLCGQSIDQICHAMGLTRIAVASRCKKIFKQEGVSGRKGFFSKYASTVPSYSLTG